MNNEQLSSLVRTILKVVGTVMLTHGATKAAALINSEDVIGVCVTVVGLVMSHIEHSNISIEEKLADHGTADGPVTITTPPPPAAQPKKDPTP